MRRNGVVLVSLGFDIKEPKRRRVIFSPSSSTTARRSIEWTMYLDDNELLVAAYLLVVRF